MAFVKQSITWKNFYGGISNDDKLTGASQVVYSSNLDLKRNSEYVQLNPASTKTVLTNGKIIDGFINVSQDTGNKKTFGYGEDGVIYWVSGTDNVPNYTATSGDDVVNAIEFNDYTYFMTTWATGTDIKYDKILSDNMYDLIGSFTQTTLATGLRGTRDDKYPMYNFLNAFLYIGVGKTIFREDNLGVKTTFELGTDDIVAITELGGVFRLYQKDGRILFWDGISDSIDSTINIDDEIRNVISHKGIDYVVGGTSDFYSNFYFMNGYQAELIQSGISSELTAKLPLSHGDKFYFKGEVGDTLSYNGQLLIINNSASNGIYEFGNAKAGFVKGFEEKFYLTPNGLNGDFFGIGKSTSQTSFYFGYDDATDTGIGQYTENGSTYIRTGTLVLPIFDGGTNLSKKKIEEIRVYSTNTDSLSTLVLKASIDGGNYSTIGTIDVDGRVILYSEVDNFFDISLRVDFDIDGATSATLANNPRLHEIRLIYTIIEE